MSFMRSCKGRIQRIIFSMRKPKKVIQLLSYKAAKEFADSIESGKLYEELKPKKQPPKIYPVK